MAKFQKNAAHAAADNTNVAATLAEVEFQEGYEFEGKDIPDKFVIETADSLFSIATSRCDDDPQKMIEMINAGAFQLATDRTTGEPFTTSEGKAVYSVPFKSNRVKTDAKLSSNEITISPKTVASDKYKDIVVKVIERQLK